MSEVLALPEPEHESGYVKERQQKQKSELIDQLKKTPIIQLACEKVGIGRATFYRWRKDDEKFAQDTDEALGDGKLLVNDMAESQLMSAIRDQNMTAIIFWLRNNHKQYTNKVEVTASVKNLDQKLTPEQQAVVEQALKLANLIDAESSDKESNPSEQSIPTAGTAGTDI